MNRAKRHYQALAGSLYLFLGAYFVAFGFLAVLWFIRFTNQRGVLLSIAGMLLGTLLALRSQRLLDWNRWIFWIVTTLIITIPILWLAPTVLSLKNVRLVPFLH